MVSPIIIDLVSDDSWLLWRRCMKQSDNGDVAWNKPLLDFKLYIQDILMSVNANVFKSIEWGA